MAIRVQRGAWLGVAKAWLRNDDPAIPPQQQWCRRYDAVLDAAPLAGLMDW